MLLLDVRERFSTILYTLDGLVGDVVPILDALSSAIYSGQYSLLR